MPELLMRQIADIITENGWNRSKRRRIMQPRLTDFLPGQVSRFSLDTLVNIAASLGRRVHIEPEAAQPPEI
jgi:predicted XRE-type DNA-binding protein